MNLKKDVCIIFVLTVSMIILISQAEGNEIGNVHSVSGEVKINGTVVTAIGLAVLSGSRIQTGPDASCEIIFGKQRIFKIHENTETKLTFETNSTFLELTIGAISSFIKRIPETIAPNRYKYRIQTGTAIAGVRGTSFFVKAETPEQTYVCACNGSIHVEDIDGRHEQSIKANHHKAVRMTRIDGLIQVQDAGMQYHTDADMEAIAKKVNSTIDWTTADQE